MQAKQLNKITAPEESGAQIKVYYTQLDSSLNIITVVHILITSS